MDSPTSSSIHGIEELAARMDTSFQYAAQRITASMGGAFSGLTTQLTGIERLLDRIASKSASIGRGAGGAGGPAARPPAAAAGYDVAGYLSSLMSGGFSPTGRGTASAGSAGLRTAEEFLNEQGRKMMVKYLQDAQGNTKLTGVSLGLQPKIDPAKTGWEQFVGSIQTGAGRIKGFVDGVGNAFVRLSGAIYTARNIVRGFDAAFVSPIEAFSKKLIDATENSRKFEIAISGVVGGMGRARELNRALTGGSASSPFTVSQLRSGAQSLALTPYSSSAMTGTTSQSLGAVNDFTGLAQRLSLISPDLSIEDAELGLRQLMEGGTAGAPLLRRKFGLSTGVLANLQGVPESKLKSDPGLMLSAAKKYVDLYLPESVLTETGNLFSVRKQKLDDAISFAFTKVGDSKVFDSMGQRLGKVTDSLFAYFNTKDFDKQANSISEDLDRIFGNVLKTIEKFLRAFTGTKGDASSVGGSVQLVGDSVHRLADISENLPAIAKDVGVAVGAFATKIGDFIDAVIVIADAIRDPVGSIRKGVTGGNSVDMGDANQALQSRILEKQNQINRVAGMGGSGRIQFGDRGTFRNVTVAQLQGEMDALRAQQNALLGNGGGVAGGASGGAGATTRPWSTMSSMQARPGWINFGPTLVGLDTSVAALGALVDKEKTKFETLAEASNSVVSKLYPVGPNTGKSIYASVFDVLGQQRDQGLEAAKDPRNEISAATVNTNYSNAVLAAQNKMFNATRDYAENLSRVLGDLPPTAQVAIQEGITSGATDLGKATAEAFRKAGFDIDMSKLGMRDRPLADRIRYSQSTDASSTALIASYGRLGNLGTYSEFDPRSQPLSDREVATLQLTNKQNQQPGLIRNFSDARDEYNAHPSDETSAHLQQTRTLLAQNLADMRDLRRETDYVTEGFLKFGVTARDALQGSLGKGIDDLIWQTGSLRDVMLGFAHDVTRAFSDMASKNLIQGIFGDFFTQNKSGSTNTGVGGLLGMLLGGGGSAASTTNVPLYTSSGAPTYVGAGGGAFQAGFTAAANGAIWPGGFHAFADGGIVRSRTYGVVGEGRYPEAIIPMPNGQSVPVHMTGSGSGEAPKVFVYMDPSQLFMLGYKAHKDVVINGVTNQYMSGKGIGKAVRRRPG